MHQLHTRNANILYCKHTLIKEINTDPHVHLCCIKIGENFLLEITPKVVFIFYFHIKNKLGVLQFQRAWLCKPKCTLAVRYTFFLIKQNLKIRLISMIITALFIIAKSCKWWFHHQQMKNKENTLFA